MSNTTGKKARKEGGTRAAAKRTNRQKHTKPRKPYPVDAGGRYV